MARSIHRHAGPTAAGAPFPRRPSRGPVSRARGGTILIVAAGLCALLASMTLVFLSQMRTQAEESWGVVRDAQARIMLYAACSYVLEAGRLGWDRYWGPYPFAATSPSTALQNGIPIHEEAFGWVDVRDGSIGPKRQDGSMVFSCSDQTTGAGPSFPAVSIDARTGAAARCPMFVWRRSRFAISPAAVYNPIDTDVANRDFGLPLLRNPDPQPQVANGWAAGAVNDAKFNDSSYQANGYDDYVHGDPTPRTNSTAMAWFRVVRIGPARFVITCGSGGTLGYQDWVDVQRDNATAQFGSQEFFNDLLNDETRLWYMVEWSPAISGVTYQCMDNEQQPDHYQWRPFNAIHEDYPSGRQSQPHARNMVGTIRWIQKLFNQPPVW
jgi:hypothetical protein